MVTNVRVDDWQRLHQQLRGIAARRAALDAEEARYLRMADRIQIWKQLGYVHMNEYLERELGYTPTLGTERLRIARELADLPRIEAALGEGALSYSAVRELTRVATRDTEGAWLAEVYGKNLRQIEALVSGRKRGDLPTDPTNPDLVKRVVRFELSPAAFATLRQTQALLADEQGSRLDDSAFIEELCRRALAGDGSSERPLHQISLTVCQSCQRGWQNGAGREIEVGPEVIAEARCDAEHIGSLSDAQPARVTTTVTPRVRRQVLARDHHACTVPGCRSARHLSVHHIEFRSDGGGNELWNMTTLCTAHHARLHEGLLTIRGKAPDALEVEWRHAPGWERERGAERPVDGVVPGTSGTVTPESVGHAEPTTLSRAAYDSLNTGDNARVLVEPVAARNDGSQGPSINEVTSNVAPEMCLGVDTTDVPMNDRQPSDLGTGDQDMCERESATDGRVRHTGDALAGGSSPEPGVGPAALPHVGERAAVHGDWGGPGTSDQGMGDQGSQAMAGPGRSDRGMGGPGIVDYSSVTRSCIRHITGSDALVGGPTWRWRGVGATVFPHVGHGVAVDHDDFVDGGASGQGAGGHGVTDECGPGRGDQDARERNIGRNGIAGRCSRHSAATRIHALVGGPTWRQPGVGAAAATVFPHVGAGVAIDDDDFVDQSRDARGTQGGCGEGTGDSNTERSGTAHRCSRHSAATRTHAFVSGPTWRRPGGGAAGATAFPHVGAGVAVDDDSVLSGGFASTSRGSRAGTARVEPQLSADSGATAYDTTECCAIDNAVKSALVTSGYKAREARAAVEHARARVGSQVTLEELLREALRSCGKAVVQTYEPAPRQGEYTDYTESAVEGSR